MSEQRRLAAILVADVVGFSRLVGADETGTLTQLAALRREIVDPNITRHSGRLFKETGDGFLVEFASAVQAVTCAMEIQKAAGPDSLPLRIGIHVGDVVVQGDDLMGDGVNIAARLEGIAKVGGVSISRQVHDQVQDRLALSFEDQGEVELKNLARPIHVFAVAGPKTAEPAPALPLPDKPSIAVLPFQNMSGDPEQEYFADGMVEDIITALSRFKSLFVIARNSSFTYKGKAVDLRQVGRELGVRYVLEGSVRKAGTKVRITGQLIDSATGAHLWADRFDGVLEEIFELQDQVTTNVVGAIVPTVDRAELGRIKRKAVENPDAYDCYLRARVRINEPTSEGLTEALAFCYRAIELEPGFSSPLGVAALAYSVRKSQGWVVDRAWEEAEVRRLASRVTQIGEYDAMALCTIGHAVAWVCRDFNMAAALIDRGLLINPNLAAAWAERALVSIYLGQHEVAIEQANRAIRLSPVDARRWFAEMMISYALLMLGRYAEAIEFTLLGRTQRPKNTPLMLASAAANALSGDIDQASTIALEALRLNPSLRLSTLQEYFILRRPQDMERLIGGLRLAGLPE